MKYDDARRLIAKLGGLFPSQLTAEQAKLLAKDFLPMSVAAVERGIHDHRADPELKDGFLNIGKLLTTCRVAERSQEMESKLNTAKEGTRADIIRRQWPQVSHVRDDREVLLRHFRREWHEFDNRRGSYSDDAIEKITARILSQCAWQLQEAGMEEAAAREWAATLTSNPDHFRMCLAEIRGNIPTKAA